MAGTISGHQLRRQALKLSDPYDQQRLIWQLPPGEALVDIFNRRANATAKPS
jgi:hypothetical protein